MKSASYDRMFVYLWEEIDKPGECKFGERWVFSGVDPETSVRKRVRESMGVRKDIYDQGDVNLIAIWDVTEYAKSIDKYYPKSKIDDNLRAKIGHRKANRGEVHTLSGEDMNTKVNDLLAKLGQPKEVAGLSPNQFNAAENVLDAIVSGKRTILAELCARFGKTIWSCALMRETDTQLTIVASYVKTVASSFEKELGKFEQFSEIVRVDTADDDYQDKIDFALQRGKQVVAYLSMCNGSKRKKRIDYLFGLTVSRMLIVDEADFGSHQIKQARPLMEARNDDDTVILMTGTNSDKAASMWKVDHMLSVTYPELLIEKKLLANAA